MNIRSALAQLFEGDNLSREQTREVFGEVMSGNTTPAQIGALLGALRVKGETPAEIAGAAEAMRALRRVHIEGQLVACRFTCGIIERRNEFWGLPHRRGFL